MSKNDMKDCICTISKNDLKEFVKTYRILLDLYPCLPDPGFTMDRLPAHAIGIHSNFLWFFDVCVPFSTFLLSVLKYFKVHISQLVPLDLRAIPDYLTWRHSCSCVLDDLPSDGYDQNDVQGLCARLICLCEIRKEVLIHSGLSFVWFNKECDPVLRRIDNNAGSDAKIVEESHHLYLSLLECVSLHTTASVSKGAIIPLPTPDEIADSIPDSRLVKKLKELDHADGADKADLADLCVKIKDSLERDKGVSMRVVSAPTPCLGKRLDAPPSIAVTSVSDPSHVGTSALASTFTRSLSLGVLLLVVMLGSPGLRWIPDDDFGTATRGEEIDLTLFPLAPGPYHMPYPYECVSSPLYTREEWNGRHASKSNIMGKENFKDPDVCRKVLDRTITLAELRRTESLLPLELSNHVNVLSALLVSHGYELNSRYVNLVSSKAHLLEKFDKKKGDVKLLRLEVTSLNSKLENLKIGYDTLGQENKELRSHRDVAFEEARKLQSQLTDAKTTSASLSKELTQTDAKLSEQALTFVGFGVESLVQKLLSSDEFHAALAHVASLIINYGIDRGLRMGSTYVEFEAVFQNVSNFCVGAKADFGKALDDFPTTPFPFLSKIVAASEGGLPDVVQILKDKFDPSATLVVVTSSHASEAPK
nr:hypothetical protein [Tanacetum cinerariifolium]